MSRIVIDARELRTSSGRYVEKLLQYLQGIDENNHYSLLLKPKDLEGWKAPENFRKVECSVKEFTFAEQTKLLDQVKELGPDLVHFTFPQQPVRYKGKTITTIHDLTTLRFVNPSKNYLVFKMKQRIFSYVMKRSVKKSFKVIVPSQFVKDDLVRFSKIKPEKVVVTHESADKIPDKAEPVAQLENEQFLMYVGRPMPHKNLERLIDAFKLLKQEWPDLHLVLAGKMDDNYRKIEAKVNKDSIQGVMFTDFVSEGQLKWLYENCLVYVFPSLSEGFGLPALEAMIHGAPVASSNATCLPEIYGDAAKYFDPLDVSSISSVITEILSDIELRKQLIEAGKKQATKYSWERMAKQTLEIYNEALNS